MDTPYENLANAIVLQAVKDYRLHDDEPELASVIKNSARQMLARADKQPEEVCNADLFRLRRQHRGRALATWQGKSAG